MPAAFDPKRAAVTHRRNLPHMRQGNVVYFVTFRTAGSVPVERIRQWHSEVQQTLTNVGDVEAVRKYVTRQIERMLDLGLGDCPLADPDTAQIIVDAFRFFDGERYLLDEFVVMPNHAHVLVCPLAEHELSQIAQSWKGYTSREINKRLGRRGPVWQDESFDHIVRDTYSLNRFRHYIRSNPAKLGGKVGVLGAGGFRARTGVRAVWLTGWIASGHVCRRYGSCAGAHGVAGVFRLTGWKACGHGCRFPAWAGKPVATNQSSSTRWKR